MASSPITPGSAMTLGPRSLADDLRGRSDDALAALVRRRPDLAAPPPGDIGQLAGRSVTAASTSRALDHLTRFGLQVVEACVVCDEPFDIADVQGLFSDDKADAVAAQFDDLIALALLWGEPGAWRPTVAVRETVGRFPAGLGPALAQLGGGDVAQLTATMDEAPDDAREVLHALTWHSPTGRVQDADRAVTTESANTPVEWLLARGVLRALDRGTVVLPRELSLHLRGGRLHATVATDAPPAELHHHDPAVVDRLASGTADEFVRQVSTVLERWAVDAPGVLRSGGLGVRDLRAAASALDADETHAALVIETAWAAGLVATSGQIDDEWLPTPAYDVWRTRGVAERWVELAQAWLESSHVASLVGTASNGDGKENALTPELERLAAPDIRRWVLEDLASFDEGTAASVESLVSRHEWRRPRRGGKLRDDLVRWGLHEASSIGICARGAVSGVGRELLRGAGGSAQSLLAELLPEPVDHVLLQADLTAVAPGPLDDELARALLLMADIESSGGATVYRFTETSVRRALDAGRSASECRDFLERVSRTPVPQPLAYLIDDVARRHGRLRIGAASAYVRCDDPVVLDELMAGRGADALRLRRLAPTVVTSRTSPEVLIERLRELGMAPAAEGGDGSVVVSRPDERRTGPRSVPQRLMNDPPPPSPTVAASIVRVVRAAERGAKRGAETRGPGLGTEVPRTAMAQTLAVLRSATEAGGSVWLGYVDNDGVAGERVVDPVALSGGQLTAYDHRTDAVRQFAVHRVTGVAPLASEA
ncbi:MAG: helicase-associated domain-containing protein [Actinomycetes bacterium]